MSNAHKVTFPDNMYDIILARIEQLNITIPEYLRHLVMIDLKPFLNKNLSLSEEEEQSLSRSFEDIKNKKFKIHNTKKSLKKHFSKVLAEQENG